jgi:hypothetical protein
MERFSVNLCVLVLMAVLAQSTSAGEFVTYSNLRYAAEHEYGMSVSLWRDGVSLIGLVDYTEGGLTGDTPAGLIQNLSFDPRTGGLSFTSRLTMGEHGCSLHQRVPSQDLPSFNGTLTEKRLSGTLKIADGLHPERPATEQRVSLQRVVADIRFASRAEWEKTMKTILQFRGPREVPGEAVVGRLPFRVEGKAGSVEFRVG